MKIKLTFLTPAFLYGADQTKPEFRIASLIGQMRYWWRMTKDWSDIKKMRDDEAKVFGLGDEGAKPFYMWLDKNGNDIKAEGPKEQDKKVNTSFKNEWLPDNFVEIQNKHPKLSYDSKKQKLFYIGFMTTEDFGNLKNEFRNNNNSSIEQLFNKAHRYVFNNKQNGLSYLFYSFNQDRKEPFSWIAPGSTVVLSLEFQKEEFKKEVLLSLFLLSCFGGLGSRSRRGAGSIAVEVLEPDSCELFNLTEENLQTYCSAEQKNENFTGYTYFSCINENSPIYKAMNNPDHYKTSVMPGASWENPLNRIGDKMRDYRSVFRGGGRTFQLDAQNLHNYAASGATTNYTGNNPLQKHAFGLPIIYNFQGTQNYIEAAPKKYERRASPLFISINKNMNEQFYATALILWEKFLPDNENIVLSVKKKKCDKPIKTEEGILSPDDSLLIDFFRSL